MHRAMLRYCDVIEFRLPSIEYSTKVIDTKEYTQKDIDTALEHRK